MLDYVISNKCIKATKQEVETALINEAKKKGFKEGVYISRTQEMLDKNDTEGASLHVLLSNGNFNFNGKSLSIDGRVIFIDGIWAEIIPVLIREEAEEKLNVKIV